ncbi:MAG: TldD/PmbA family protein [Nanoarchaeota archaeon]|nr:TldD/PmbA family protein [Nanoarchaeota archaeon]
MEGFEKVITRRKLITFTFRKGRLREVEEKELKTVDIRLTKDNKSVFCSGTDEEDCLKRAKKMLKHVKRVEFFGLPSPSKYEKVKLFDERILGLTEKELLHLAEGLITPWNTYASFSREIREVEFENSNGVRGEYEVAFLSGEVEVKHRNAISYESHTTRKLEDFSWVGKEAYELCKLSLGKRKMKKGIYPVTLSPTASADLLSIISSHFHADLVQKGISKAIGWEFSKDLTMCDDGLLPFGLNTAPFDGEGVPCRRTILMKGGKVRGFLYDFTTARKEGKESTGNFLHLRKRPNISERNLIVKPRKKLELEGIYIKHLVGIHTANESNGDFSLNTENAFLIKGGEWIPLKNVMLSGNVFELLKEVEVGDDLRQEDKIASPSLFFPRMNVIS